MVSHRPLEQACRATLVRACASPEVLMPSVAFTQPLSARAAAMRFSEHLSSLGSPLCSLSTIALRAARYSIGVTLATLQDWSESKDWARLQQTSRNLQKLLEPGWPMRAWPPSLVAEKDWLIIFTCMHVYQNAVEAYSGLQSCSLLDSCSQNVSVERSGL